MGCDIHFRVEYYGPIETVVRNDSGEITVAPEGDFAWQPAEKYDKNEWIVRWEKALAEGQLTQKQFDEYVSDEPAVRLNYGDRFYTGRNYSLFGKLSGVRRDGYDEICGEDNPRFGTLPPDTCPEIYEELGPEDGDLHSRGWATLKELLDADWSDLKAEGENFGYSGFGHTLLSMEAVAIEKCGGDTTKVRAVWAYDN